GGNGGLREFLDLGGLADIDAVGRYLARARFADLGGHLLQPGLVAVGKRQVAAARRQLQGQRAADAAGGAGHGGRASGYRSHFGRAPCSRGNGRVPATFANWNRTIKLFPHLMLTTRQKGHRHNRRESRGRLTWDNQNRSARPHSSLKTTR